MIMAMAVIFSCLSVSPQFNLENPVLFENPENTVIEYAEPVQEEKFESAEFKVTAYCNCTRCCGKYAATNTRDGITYGSSGQALIPMKSIAADKRFPFGTILIDEWGNEYIVADRGGSIKGNKIDLFFSSHEEALQWGVKYKTLKWRVE